jgi:hypothetical protein
MREVITFTSSMTDKLNSTSLSFGTTGLEVRLDELEPQVSRSVWMNPCDDDAEGGGSLPEWVIAWITDIRVTILRTKVYDAHG